MSTVNLSDYKDLYLQSAREYLESLSKSCEQLSANLLDKEALKQLHISSHSLRSQSQVMGYANINKLTGVIENIARDAIVGSIRLTGDIIADIKKSAKEVEEMLR